ncbi:hypothetical protein [Magnetospirillum sp. SS-4]|uniref:hypothetical protein n=1 Tax=Magnetospirillum sp. SS-4 TaxID=2681465 RepID=UPI0013825352|nr:hypothetical protein [Magnetospirillum sp. SS-4]CAA7619055.1 hypothetical protein MTBSS4_230047 [Magnetospirillum sp. SS-4]
MDRAAQEPVVPTLHILPVFFCDTDIASIKALKLTCDVEALGQSISGLKTRRLYPNKHYFVAGTRDFPHGLLLALPDPMPETVMVKMLWRLPLAAIELTGVDTVDHEVEMILEPTDRGQVFSMERMALYWRGVPEHPPVNTAPKSTYSRDLLSDLRKDVWGGQEGGTVRLKEKLDVPASLLADVFKFRR